ncbi:putative cyclin-dependent serine/threonine-protein kinase DDB_G0272797/DDB_G0274007 isoform X2 [Nilaparvata lugens]|nr:putative cyclin-dependent serine/threonine-protein kinase DDB_G0272797/DDB_G0274007 isoform X2 [Nilaparvata lugens]
MNAVRLCFHVFLEGEEEGKFNVPICPVVSQPIYDKKSTSDFAIVELSRCSAPVDGGEKIILLCHKVMKDDIKIHFYEEVDGQIVWQDYGEFEPNNVHYQYAISFKTPPYKDLNVTGPVQVKIQLVRPSDNEVGPEREFQLTPIKLVSSSYLPRKKAKISIIPQLGKAEAELSRSKHTLFKLDLEREQEMRAADEPMPSTSGAFRQQSLNVYDTHLPATSPVVSHAVIQAASQDASAAAIAASLQACHNAYKPPPFSQPPSNQSLPQMGQPPDPINMSQLPPQQIVNYLNLMHPLEHNIVHQHNPMQHNINIQEEHSPLQHNLVDGVTQQQHHQPQQQHHYQLYQKRHHHQQQQQHEQQEQQQHLQLPHYHQQQQQHQQKQHHHQQQQQQQQHHQQQHKQQEKHQEQQLQLQHYHQQQQQHQQLQHHHQQQQQHQQHHHQQQQQQHHQQQQQHQQYHYHGQQQQQQQQQHHHQQQQQQQHPQHHQQQQQHQHQQYHHHEQNQQQQQQHHHQQQQQQQHHQQQHLQNYQQQQLHQQYHHHEQQQQQQQHHHQQQQQIQHQVQTMDTQQHLTEQGGADILLDSSDLNYNISDNFLQNLSDDFLQNFSLGKIEAVDDVAESLKKNLPDSLPNYNQNNENNGNNSSPSGQNSN